VREVISGIEQQLAEPTAKGLAGAVSRAVREGTLTAGDRLPPIRDLARELALSPTTVSAAWALLVRSGTIETAGRRGTRVADPRQPRDGRYRQALEHQTAFALDLSTGIPDAALLPSLDRAVRQLTTAGTPASYLDEPVLPELLDVLAETWPYPAPTLTVVDGAMDGLELVIRTSLRYGDRVVVEHPTFPPLLDLLEAAGVEVTGVRLDEEGIVPQDLESALEQPAQALFLQPRAHNPTGTSTTPRRVRTLGRLLGRLPSAADLLVVEDDSANAISTSPDLSLGTLLPDRTVHVRSFSKSHGPDLRLAAMSGPEELMASVRHLRQLGQGWSSRLLQRLLVGLLTDERTRAEVAAAREEYARRRTRFVERLSEHGVPTVGTDGLNVWVPVHDEAAALMRLASLGIGVAPGAPFAVLPERTQHVRVTVGLVGERLEHVADEVARAARTGGRRAGAR
jgi:DNA-binding transcriptional MocR family regulator